ncbi:hypothetical protein [Streptomyces sp. BK79]|uniref:hypothetical protein n=1 Tax=Streptomyces sp. BK79 TaxID=3350097 RepID=UPI003770264F
MSSHTRQKTTPQTTTRQTGSERGDICPSCGHHVPAEVQRHKTLGVYVPVWHPGTCRNPDCGASAPGRDR